MNTQDRRVRRSRRLLSEALLTLIQKRDFDSIKVRDVTDLADVGYMTFYRHYHTLEDLLIDGIREMIQAQLADVLACDEQGELIFSIIAKHEALYRTLLFAPSTARARQKLVDLFSAMYRITAKDEALIPADLRARHMAMGLTALASWWLEHRLSPPIPQVAQMYNALIIHGNVDDDKMRQLTTGACGYDAIRFDS